MTIPIAPVNIGTQGQVQANPQQERFFQMLLAGMQAVQSREELDLARKRLGQQRAEFELRAKGSDKDLETVRLRNEQLKRQFAEEDANLTAKDEALRIFTGSLPQLSDSQGIGTVIAGIKDPRVAGFFYDYLRQHQTAISAGPSFEFKPTPDTTSPTGYGYTALNPKKPTEHVRTGVPAVDPNEPTRRVPVITEREKASGAIGAAQANAIINAMETADSTIAARVARKVANRRALLGAVAKRLAGVPEDDIAIAQEAQIEQGLTPDELQYYQGQKQYLSNVIAALSGKTVTAREYVMHAPAYFSMGGTTPQVTLARRKARAQRVVGFIKEAGDAMTERLPELATPEEYGLGPPPQPKRKYRSENIYVPRGP